ncbi:triose-phosphate isomerase [Salipaludibacillus neizhouensis]|uniref:Triosephosphate isomerase n=1 Tax=Salipaludibacillus neizhouensis TaxID=885475 RepID=A0A3A9KA66_9BACI|nr:triose-phosphate isomerase [Salipaludibacillus neizhouensis]RKL66463.1 triose-phosphate isomerase [Salipaludibacillus neizhouensis]
MDKIWVGTNWKMTKTISEGISYTKELKHLAEKITSDIELFIIPSHTALIDIKREVSNSRIRLGAQNMHWEDNGAYTGEISPRMLHEIGIDLIELGHSERRQYFNENDYEINKKIFAALRYGMKPIICIGENIEQKNNSASYETLASQLKICLNGLTEKEAKQVLVAYEPVWAIGEKGIPADSKYVGEIHTYLRQVLVEMFPESGLQIPLLYGGSVNLDNFLKYIEQKDVNGLFVGRTAWNMETFTVMIKELEKHLYN